MRYLGGKGRLAKQIAYVILSTTKRRDCLLETCLGGAHAHEQLAPHFAFPHAGDVHPDLILMWQAAAKGWVPPSIVTEEQYRWLKDQPPSALRGFVGFCCSYAGMWFKCPARHVKGVPLEHDDVAAAESRVVVRTARALARTRIEWTSYESWSPLIEAAPERWVTYCFLPGANVLTNDERLVTIEDVRKDDLLWGGRKVQMVIHRHYVGDVVAVKVQGNPHTPRFTADHPVLALRGRSAGARQDTRTILEREAAVEFVSAGDLRVGDYLMLPQKGTVVEPVLWSDYWIKERSRKSHPRSVSFVVDDRAIGRLLGYYASEGHLQYDARHHPCSVFFSFNSKETLLIDDVVRLARAVFVGAPVDVLEGKIHSSVTQVRISGVQVAEFFARLVPGKSRSRDQKQRHTKQLDQRLMTAPGDVQREILACWLRGDGGFESDKRGRYSVMGRSSSRILAWQMYRIAQRLGLRPSWKVSKPTAPRRIEDRWTQSAAAFNVDFTVAEDVEAMGFPAKERKRQSCAQRRFVNDYLAVRIKEITRMAYAGMVHNLDVDQDSLLCVDGVISHNCDPPYAGTAEYDGTDGFDHIRFWNTLDRWTDLGAEIFVSEYTAPAHWSVLGEVEHTCMVNASRSDETGKRVERLFTRARSARPASGWEAEFLARVEAVRASRAKLGRGRSLSPIIVVPPVVAAPAVAPYAQFARTAMVVR